MKKMVYLAHLSFSSSCVYNRLSQYGRAYPHSDKLHKPLAQTRRKDSLHIGSYKNRE